MRLISGVSRRVGGRLRVGERGDVGDRRGVAAAVVVEHDDDAPAAVAEVVERLVGHPTGHRAVADHGDDVAVRVAPGVTGGGEPVGVREDRRGVAVLDVVVAALLARRVAGEAAGLAQLGEPGAAPGHHLVDVGLVAGVPEDGVARRLEHAVQGQRQLDGAEVGAEVAAGLGDGRDDEVTDLTAQLGQFRIGELTEVLGFTNPIEDHGPGRYPASGPPEQVRGDRRHLRSARHDASSISRATSAWSPVATAASGSATPRASPSAAPPSRSGAPTRRRTRPPSSSCPSTASTSTP